MWGLQHWRQLHHCVAYTMKTAFDQCPKTSRNGRRLRSGWTSATISPLWSRARRSIQNNPFPEYGHVYLTALSQRSKTFRRFFADFASSNEQDEGVARKKPPACVKCSERLSLLCCCCIECEGLFTKSGWLRIVSVTPHVV